MGKANWFFTGRPVVELVSSRVCPAFRYGLCVRVCWLVYVWGESLGSTLIVCGCGREWDLESNKARDTELQPAGAVLVPFPNRPSVSVIWKELCLWMLRKPEVVWFLTKTGLTPASVSSHLPSKTVFHSQTPRVWIHSNWFSVWRTCLAFLFTYSDKLIRKLYIIIYINIVWLPSRGLGIRLEFDTSSLWRVGSCWSRCPWEDLAFLVLRSSKDG